MGIHQKIATLMKWILKLLVFSIFTTTCYTKALTHSRADIPDTFKKSYIGLSIGWIDIPFTNQYLNHGLSARKIETPNIAPRIFIGHFFTPNIAIQMSLMRPIKWIYFRGIQYPEDRHTVWTSMLGVTLQPTVKLLKKIALYGDIGLGIISRHGFKINDQFAVTHQDLVTLLTGGGLTYAINPHWHYDLGIAYTPKNHRKKQPNIFYAYTGFYYLILPSNRSNEPHFFEKKYIFPLNFLQGGFFTNKWFYANVNKYVSQGHIPIFWDGKLKNRNGVYLMYERNFFHTNRTLSLEWGTSIARYQTHLNQQTYYAFSVFPVLKIWIIRSNYIDSYFTYSLAGPTYITRYYLDHINTGSHFTFQDFMGIGFFLGRKKNINVNLKIGHYSNGNILPINTGIEVPLTIAVGFTFN